MSFDLSPFIYLWRGCAWDHAKCVKRDDEGNPTEVWFLRKKKVILKYFVAYDDNGDWSEIWTEIPKTEKKKK